MADEKVVEVMAAAFERWSEQSISRIPETAPQSLSRYILAALEKEGYAVVPADLLRKVIGHAADGQDCVSSQIDHMPAHHAATAAAFADIARLSAALSDPPKE